MRELTKGRTLDQLMAQHMSGEDSYHRASFRYLLREGKVALLFDGFDELAQRTDYDRVVDHFNTLREAAGGSAKVIVTSRHQYFATDRDVLKALGGQAQALPGSRIMRLLPLDAGQRRTIVVDDFNDEAKAEHFLALLGDVRDLLSLAENPRMLSFMIRWYQEGLLTDANLAAGRRADHRRAALRAAAEHLAGARVPPAGRGRWPRRAVGDRAARRARRGRPAPVAQRGGIGPGGGPGQCGSEGRRPGPAADAAG